MNGYLCLIFVCVTSTLSEKLYPNYPYPLNGAKPYTKCVHENYNNTHWVKGIGINLNNDEADCPIVLDDGPLRLPCYSPDWEAESIQGKCSFRETLLGQRTAPRFASFKDGILRMDGCVTKPIYQEFDLPDVIREVIPSMSCGGPFCIYPELAKPYTGPVKIKSKYVVAGCWSKREEEFKYNYFGNFIPKPQLSLPPTKALKDPPSLVLLLVDAVSRAAFYRAMRHTAQYLESLHKEGSGYDIYQLMRLHATGFRTWENMPQMLAGKVAQLGDPFKMPCCSDCMFVPQFFQESGYRTLLATDVPYSLSEWGISTCNESTIASLFDYSFVAHQAFVEWKRDPNLPPDAPKRHPSELHTTYDFSGRIEQRCWGGGPLCESILQHTLKFLDHHSDHPRFAYVHILDGHDPSQAGLVMADLHIKRFLQELVKRGSDFLLLADHGITYGWMYDETLHGRVEGSLPLAIMGFKSNSIDDSVRKSLLANQQRLLTHFDIHRTLFSLPSTLHGIQLRNQTVPTHEGIDIFHNIGNYSRTCADAGIPGLLCACLKWTNKGPPFRDIHMVAAYLNMKTRVPETFGRCKMWSTKNLIVKTVTYSQSLMRVKVFIKNNPTGQIGWQFVFQRTRQSLNQKIRKHQIVHASRITEFRTQKQCGLPDNLMFFCVCR